MSRVMDRIDGAWVARWMVLPALLAVLLAAHVDPRQPPIFARDRLSAVLLLDGQAYFGRLSENPFSGSIELRDVYYFQDARDTSTNVPLGLVRRGSEAHRPADGMIIQRDRVVAIETVGPASEVALAIAVDRDLRRASVR